MSWDFMAGVGQGLGAIGGMMSQWADEDEKKRARLELEREKIADRQARAEDANLMKMMIASQRGEGGSKGSGIDFKEQDGNPAYEAMLLKLGEGDRRVGEDLWKNRKTGEYTTFGKDEEMPTPVQGDSPGSVRVLSEEAQKLIRKRNMALADIMDEFTFGDKYKNVTEGRRTVQGMKMTDAVLAGDVDAGEGAAAMNAGADKPGHVYGGPKEVSRNLFTGEETINAIGKAEIAELGARASKEKAGEKDQRVVTLEGRRKAAANELASYNAELANMAKEDAATADPKDPARIARRKEIAAGIKSARERILAVDAQLDTLFQDMNQKKSGAGSAGKTAGSSSDAPYPDGTRLTGPDGKRYVVRNGKPVRE